MPRKPSKLNASDQSGLEAAARRHATRRRLPHDESRFKCVLRYHQGGITQRELAADYRVSLRCVASWLGKFHEGGLDGLNPKGFAGGRRPFLDDEAQEILRAKLAANRHGAPAALKVWLEQRIGRAVKSTQLRYWMKKLAPHKASRWR